MIFPNPAACMYCVRWRPIILALMEISYELNSSDGFKRHAGSLRATASYHVHRVRRRRADRARRVPEGMESKVGPVVHHGLSQRLAKRLSPLEAVPEFLKRNIEVTARHAMRQRRAAVV